MKLEDMVLSDGRKLLDVWPKTADLIDASNPVAFLSISAGQAASLFLERRDNGDHSLMLHTFCPDGSSYVMGTRVEK